MQLKFKIPLNPFRPAKGHLTTGQHAGTALFEVYGNIRLGKLPKNSWIRIPTEDPILGNFKVGDIDSIYIIKNHLNCLLFIRNG